MFSTTIRVHPDSDRPTGSGQKRELHCLGRSRARGGASPGTNGVLVIRSRVLIRRTGRKDNRYYCGICGTSRERDDTENAGGIQHGRRCRYGTDLPRDIGTDPVSDLLTVMDQTVELIHKPQFSNMFY